MASVVLWGRASSANVQKARWALEEVGIDYDLKEVGGKFGGLDTPQFTGMNPNGRVPVFQDQGLTVWESHAIVRYIAAKFGAGSLWPEALEQRARVDQWTDWTATTFQPVWLELFALVVRTAPDRRDVALIKAMTSKTLAMLEIMSEPLSRSAFLAGDQFTYADIVAGVSLFRLTTMEVDVPLPPAILAWHERLRERPAFVKSVEISYDDLRPA